MTKRIKKVFSTADQVLHLWANQSQKEARSSNVFFEGNTCYSYGIHYTLGKLVKFKGKTVAVINDRGYSVTTAKHIGMAWQAVSHLPRVYSTELKVLHGLKTTREKLVKQLDGLLKRRSFWQWNALTLKDTYEYERVTEFNNLCKLLGTSKYRIKIAKTFEKQFVEHVNKCRERENLKKSPEYQAKLQAKKLAKAERDITNWRNGGQLTNNVRKLERQLLRVQGDTVQTSRGANVPLDQALRLLKNVENNRSVSGESIGDFVVNEIGTDIVKIGCHIIELSEARQVLGRVAPKL